MKSSRILVLELDLCLRVDRLSDTSPDGGGDTVKKGSDNCTPVDDDSCVHCSIGASAAILKRTFIGIETQKQGREENAF